MENLLFSEIKGFFFLLFPLIGFLIVLAIGFLIDFIGFILKIKDHFRLSSVTDPKDQYDLGIKYLNGLYNQHALKWFLKAAEQNYTEAEFKLGQMYAKGTGVIQNMPEAVKWFLKAAEKEHANAQYQLARIYAYGNDVEKNIPEAIKWYRKAAENGLAEAQNKLAQIYADGKDVERDIAEAELWSRKGAEQGKSRSKKLLDFCLCYHAAEQGDANSQFELGQYYYNGHGIEKNIGEAIKWYRKASENGLEEAQYILAQINVYDKSIEQNTAEDSHKFSMQRSTDIGSSEGNQNVISQTETELPQPVDLWGDAALGIKFYYIVFIISIILPILVPILSGLFLFFENLISMRSDVGAGVCIVCSLSFTGIIFYMLLSMFFLSQTPKEIVPNAQKKILLSFFLMLIVETFDFVEICSPEFFCLIIPDSFYKAYQIISLGMMFCSYYIFYSFLNVIGKKTIQKSCNVAIFFLTASYILLALVIILSNPAPLDDVEYVSSISDLYKGDNITLLISSWVSYIIGSICLFGHVFQLNNYFKNNNLRKKFNEEEVEPLLGPCLFFSMFVFLNLFANLITPYLETFENVIP